MKPILTLLGIFICIQSFSQQTPNQLLQTNQQYTNANSMLQYQMWDNNENLNSAAASAAADIVLWSEDFANGLSGNNSSTVQTWTVVGTHNNLWEHDMDGSTEGPYASNPAYTLNSETKDNGWMIFDADKGNIGVISPANKHGELISPSIDLSQDTNVSIKFTQAYRYCCESNYKLKIYIYNGTIWSNGIDINLGSQVNKLKETTHIELNISQYAALKSDVKIKFAWEANGAGAYFWMIDDVKILKTQAHSAKIIDAWHVTPSTFGGTISKIMNLEQAKETAYQFGGVLLNNGYENINDTRIYAAITNQSTSYQSSTIVSSPTQTDTLYTVDGFTPTDSSSIGVYYVNVFGGNDANQLNTDSILLRFEISEFEYGKDEANYNPNFASAQLNKSDSSYEVGNTFTIYKTAELKTVKIKLDSKTKANGKGRIKIYEMKPNNIKDFVYESQQENIGQHSGNWFDFTFNDPFNMQTGKSYIVVLYSPPATMANESVHISTSGFRNRDESYVKDIDGSQGGSYGMWYLPSYTPCLRLKFAPISDINEKNNLEQFSINPNPNKGIFNINIKTKSTENLNLYITNILGQEIYSESLFNVNILNKQINLSHLEKGIYFVNLLSETGTTTQKMVYN